MSVSASPYALPHGIRLLQAAVEELGPLFTRAELLPLAERQGLSRGHLSRLLSALSDSGYIKIIKRGVYLVRSPLFAEEIHPFAIAAVLVQPAAISHWSALAHHGFTTQIPTAVQVSTPSKVITPEMRHGRAYRPRGRAVWRVMDLEVEFIHVRASRFFGHERVWVDRWHQVSITDRERTALDLIARPEVFGGMAPAIEILDENLSHLALPRLVAYTLRYGVGAVIKRMGWILENLGVPHKEIEPLREYPVKNYYRLDPQGPPGGKPNARWHIKENLRSVHA